MSDAKVCNNCATVLMVDARGEDPDGEIAGWVQLAIGRGAFVWDACTRACAHELLDGLVAEVSDNYAAAVAEVARAIRQDGEVMVAGPCRDCGEKLLECIDELDRDDTIVIYQTVCPRCGERGDDIGVPIEDET